MRKLAAVLAFLMLSGCSSGPDSTPQPDPDPESPVLLEGALAAYMAGNETSNMHRLAQVYGSGAAEIDACGDFLFIDAGSSVQILNVSNPAEPFEVGAVTGLPGILDVKVSADCNWLFVGEDAEGSIEPLGGTGPFTGGFYVVDVTDKSAPTLASRLNVGPRRGPHMVFYHQTADGDELVFGANADVSINRFDRATGTLT